MIERQIIYIQSQLHQVNRDVTVQGLSYSSNVQNVENVRNGLIWLTLWYYETYNDNYVSTDAPPRDDAYIFRNDDENETFSEKYKNDATDSIENIKELMVSLEYTFKFVSNQGYVTIYISQTQKLIAGTANVTSKSEKKNKNEVRKTRGEIEIKITVDMETFGLAYETAIVESMFLFYIFISILFSS